MDKIVSGMIPVVKALNIPETRDNCIAQFVLRVRDKLHIVLGMSPVGSALRVRCRNFASLIRKDGKVLNEWLPRSNEIKRAYRRAENDLRRKRDDNVHKRYETGEMTDERRWDI